MEAEEVGFLRFRFRFHRRRTASTSLVLSCLFELRDKIQQFLREAGHELAGYFDKPEFIQVLAYLADLFTALNELNRSLQEKIMSILVASEKLSAFKRKTLAVDQAYKERKLGKFSFS